MQTQENCDLKEQTEGLRSEVSVFLALITVLVASLILSSVELLRTQAARTYLTVAANSAVDSLFSQYHLELWERYRLLGLEMYAEEEAESEYRSFLEPYLSAKETWNLYGLSEEEGGVRLEGYVKMTDENGAVFEKEVLDYMKVGWALEAAGLAEAQKDLETLESAKSTGEVSEELQGTADVAMDLQKKLQELSRTVQNHNGLRKELGEELSRGNGTRAEALCLKLERSLASVESKIGEVRSHAEKLRQETDGAALSLQQKHMSGAMTEENYGLLRDQLDNYRAYSDSQSEQNRELWELEETAVRNREVLETLRTEVKEAEDYISSWVPDQILVRYDPPKKEGEKPVPVYEDEVLDEAAVWQEAAEVFAEYEVLSFSCQAREADEELADALQKVSDLLTGNLLLLVCPDAEKISKTERDLTEAPSSRYLGENTNVFNDEDYMLNKIAVSEYAMLELSNLKAEKESLCRAELEYVLWGRKSDCQNVSDVAAELIAVRTGLNLAYLFKDKTSMMQAGELAVSVTGAAAGTPLVLVITFLILSIWAAGQAVLDVRDLFSGEKVPFVHTKKTFTLTLNGLLSDFGNILKQKRTNETGLTYAQYLRLLLYSRPGSQSDYRIMDVIQENLRTEQSDFRMDRLYTSADISVSAGACHVFISPGLSRSYRLTVNTYYAYSE